MRVSPIVILKIRCKSFHRGDADQPYQAFVLFRHVWQDHSLRGRKGEMGCSKRNEEKETSKNRYRYHNSLVAPVEAGEPKSPV